jgi:membrane-associated phospholipid phosphatase
MSGGEGLRGGGVEAGLLTRQARSGALARLSRSAAAHRDLVVFVGAVVVPLAVFTALGIAFAGRGAHGWDGDVVRFVERHYHESVAERLNLILNVSIGLGAAISIAAVVVLVANGRRLDALFWTLAVGGVLALDLPLKQVFHRPPIDDPGGGYSFPSGNAMASAAIVAAIVLTFPHRWRRPALVVGVPLVAVYGVLLVVQSWHYPSDVVAGWCFALAWTTALWLGLRRATKTSTTRTRGAVRSSAYLSRGEASAVEDEELGDSL